MIKLFLYSIAALVIALVVTLFLARDPGYLLISFGHYTFETSLFALFVALVILLLLWRLLVLFLAWINPLNLISVGRSWSENRQHRKELHESVAESINEALLVRELEALGVADNGKTATLAELRKFWKKRVKDFADDPDVIGAYVDALVRANASQEAIAVLENALDRHWHDTLIRRYSLLSLQVDDELAAKQLQHAETWLQSRVKDGGLLLALGRLSLRSHLWGKAKDYLERSLRIEPDAEVFAELARLLLNLKEPERNAQYLRLQTKSMSTALPHFPQP
ncbi:MAG: heme biosynthesis HemY N-terminal domain-containing protein [Gammaproteobacteria bacterium]|nr:heme biosynthesis HemY N-terminal domain-containing protein [Gammaproteobacteria bacterium]MDP2139974.1 heme biosynthesis HemY N-terminal domain-containing protein [Gammaproteobacteria bacterium]MDP2347794.1 heme biosynthesis HemY N-terminal domain-containing protein [Gammaproteobacteria bacterium]